jgi:hypothetical protein
MEIMSAGSQESSAGMRICQVILTTTITMNLSLVLVIVPVRKQGSRKFSRMKDITKKLLGWWSGSNG